MRLVTYKCTSVTRTVEGTRENKIIVWGQLELFFVQLFSGPIFIIRIIHPVYEVQKKKEKRSISLPLSLLNSYLARPRGPSCPARTAKNKIKTCLSVFPPSFHLCETTKSTNYNCFSHLNKTNSIFVSKIQKTPV